MPFVTVTGVQVNFPFEPYDCQVDYMQKVVTCLRDGYNGILESPTGTGKTLCLLCSSLAWLEDKKAQIANQRWSLAQTETSNGALDVYKDQLSRQLDSAAGVWSGELAAPKIIYASRTHSQLSQAIQELKRTAYAHFKVCVVGSREQLCIHPQIMKEESNSTKVHLCRSKVSTKTCNFYNNIENTKTYFQNQVMDIEDLVRLGEKHNCCPYYMAREIKTDADIIFMPYNYLLDPKTRKAHGVELQGNIVIFDEAHNLERICEESASFDLNSADLASAIREIDSLSQKLQEMHSNDESGFDISSTDTPNQGMEFTLEEVLQLKAQILHLEEELDGIPLAKPEEGVTKDGSYIFQILERVNLSFESKHRAIDVIDKMVSFLAGQASHSLFSSKGTGLAKFSDMIKIVFSREPDERANLDCHKKIISRHYKVHIREENKKPYKKKNEGWGAAPASAAQKPSRTLSYWCFSPGHAMEDLKAHGVKSIILTSGTLSPMSSFKAEMGIPFQIQLENPHVIERHQVWIGIMGRGPDGALLSSAYTNRFKEEYQSSLGNAVVNFARVVPDGLLLFFPSYPVMEKCLDNWQGNNVWNRVEQYKPIFVEPKIKAEFQTAMINFYDKINDPSTNGAVFAAVCRGKVSEGLDFADTNGRAVVITGLPFPPRMDPRVMLKMQYLDDARKAGGNGLTGQQWYRQQASRAVNQAIGRVIRHKQDYGAILLCDDRFSQADAISQLPGWIKPYATTYPKFGIALRDMMGFFKAAQQKMPQPRPKQKQNSRAAQQGCQGAYFMPTLAREVSTKVGNLEKAGFVGAHVPSLVKSSASQNASLAKLKIQYEETTASDNTSKMKQGLLDALQSTDKVSSAYKTDATHLEPSCSYETSSTRDKAIMKKKIVVKKSGTSSNVEKDSLQSAEEYVSEVKKTLSVESYKFFSKSLASYKKTGDYTAMVAALADVFTDNQQKYHLFRRFYRFVRPHHKQQFDQTCKEIIGQGCGFKPEDAISKKRNMSDSKEVPTEKKRKFEPGQNSKATERCSSIQASSTKSCNNHLDSESHLNQGVTARDGKEVPSFPSSSQTLLSSCTAKVQAEENVERTEQNESSCTTSGKENLKESGSVGNQETDGATNQHKPSTTLHSTFNRAETDYTCCYCTKNAVIPLKAQCHHVCCMDCWKECIREKKHCPKCGVKVRRKNLSRVFFP